MCNVDVERHLAFEIKGVLHENAIDSAVSSLLRQLDRRARRLQTRTRQQSHCGGNLLSGNFDELQLLGMFQIYGLAIGAENKITFDSSLYVFLDVASESVVSDRACLLERRNHWWDNAFKV